MNIVVRANPDGSVVRLKDVARVELGAQNYSMMGRLNGKPAAVLATLPVAGNKCHPIGDGVTKLMEEAKKSFPPDLDYKISLDTTLSVTRGYEGDPQYPL